MYFLHAFNEVFSEILEERKYFVRKGPDQHKANGNQNHFDSSALGRVAYLDTHSEFLDPDLGAKC